MSKTSNMFTGERVTDKEVSFENLAYATVDVSIGEGLMMNGTRGFIPEIVRVMDSKREFYDSDLFPNIHFSKRAIYDDVLVLFGEIGVLEGLGNGKYRANEKVLVKRGLFKFPTI